MSAARWVLLGKEPPNGSLVFSYWLRCPYCGHIRSVHEWEVVASAGLCARRKCQWCGRSPGLIATYEEKHAAPLAHPRAEGGTE